MQQRQYPSEDLLVEQDIFSGKSKVTAELANWSLGHDGGPMDSIVVSFDKTPSEILQLIANAQNTIITDNGEIGTTANKDQAYKIGEYKLIASAEHSFNAVVCCFDSSQKYNLNNSSDCNVFNAAYSVSMNAIRGISVPGSVKAIPFFAASDNGFISITFDKNPIAQQVYDSEFWNGVSGTTTTTAPAWFLSAQNKKGSSNAGSSEKKGGYVATAVYGSYDCPEVWTLRRFRDRELAEHWYGRAFIRIYYAISPTIVKLFGSSRWFNRIWRKRLDLMVRKLNEKGYDSSPYTDKGNR